MRHSPKRSRERGQSVVEFALVIPILLTMVLGIAEFGVAFGTNMTLISATREGARVGAALGNGSASIGCPGATGSASVDPQIIAAVQRVIESPGSGINKANVDWIHIFQSDASGGEVKYNEWKLGSGGTICGVALDFKQGSVGWSADLRSSTLPVVSIGVRIQYRYTLYTPLSAITGLFGTGQITMVDSTVMAIEP